MSRVDDDLAAYDAEENSLRAAFARLPADARSEDWVRAKLAHMSAVDQLMRGKVLLPSDAGYSEDERRRWDEAFFPRFRAVDERNTRELKELLAVHGWFTVSEWGEQADQDAWLLVQHADEDLPFQKEVLSRLEALHERGETSPRNLAYLHDRVAVAEGRPQRYGTQGGCAGPGRWEPKPIEDPDRVEERRKAMGLESMAENIRRVSEYCR